MTTPVASPSKAARAAADAEDVPVPSPSESEQNFGEKANEKDPWSKGDPWGQFSGQSWKQPSYEEYVQFCEWQSRQAEKRRFMLERTGSLSGMLEIVLVVAVGMVLGMGMVPVESGTLRQLARAAKWKIEGRSSLLLSLESKMQIRRVILRTEMMSLGRRMMGLVLPAPRRCDRS